MTTLDQPRTGPGAVLAGVDETPISCIAVDHAAIEAELRGWPLRLVNVRGTGSDGAGAHLLQRLTDRVHASAPSTPVTSRIVLGEDPARGLLAEAVGAGLVVVGHRHGITSTTLGRSVADRIGRMHSGPVLVVRMPGWPAGPEYGTRPIVVAADDTPPARAAVDFALGEAQARGCDVTLLHISGGSELAYRRDVQAGVSVHHRVVEGDPVLALVEASGTAAAVVVTRTGPAAYVLPQRALCPVFLVG
ncbi:universal stress protein [Actinoplanes sp. NPDC049802]|uniref:universal stress protein n=1 Tax=Actinoplanes sp. NPDC049802 TaxID=3154742 RepID=UPI0033C7D5B4